MRRLLFSAAFVFICSCSFAQDAYLKVHFLYGSKPQNEHKDTEPKSFGGILGGHVGIEGDNGLVFSFGPAGSFHVVNKKEKHSSFYLHDVRSFYSVLGGNPDSVKKAVVYVPVSAAQKQMFDSIAAVYLKEVPYDYAFLGMRCGAAAYEILGQLDIVPEYSILKTSKKIFYPERLRSKLLRKAEDSGWRIERQHGSPMRVWEAD